MDSSKLHQFHESLGARFLVIAGGEAVADYGYSLKEHQNLSETAGVLDLSFRSRLCLVGTDRVRFLHGQVTNDIKRLTTGQGCYAALVTAKGRMQSDLNIYCLAEELLLDFEPGLSAMVTERLERYVVADDVQVVDVSSLYGLLSVQGPKAAEAVSHLDSSRAIPSIRFQFNKISDPEFGEIYLVKQPRLGTDGFDVFVPASALEDLAQQLTAGVKRTGGDWVGWTALETARIEAGIPRFGLDMDEANLPQECGIESLAISYHKGCYIGQEVLNRLHTLGHVNRELRGLYFADDLEKLPQKGDRLIHDAREVGVVTSVVVSPRWRKTIGLGYVRRESGESGTKLIVRSGERDSPATVVDLPSQ